MPQSALVLVDGSSFLYRAYYAAKTGFTTKSGIPTGATLIITNMLRKLQQKYAGQAMAVVFDARGKSFRHELYAAYKANRPHMPEDLVPQVENVQAIVKAMGCALIVVPGVEADDVLGSYAKAAENRGQQVVICTGDKDLAQLVTDKITLYDSMNEKIYDRQGVIVKYGVPPELIIDLLALKGDSSDNIPGMSKVGDVTAISLLTGVGGIAAIEAHSEMVASLNFRGAKTFAKRFFAELETIKLSYDLATIRTNLPLPIPLEDIKPPLPDHQKLLEIYTKLEFKRLCAEESQALAAAAAKAETSANQPENIATTKATTATEAMPDFALSSPGSKDEPQVERKLSAAGEILQRISDIGLTCQVVTTQDELQALCTKLKAAPAFAFDTETDSLQAQTCRLVGLSVALSGTEAYYIPLCHEYLGCPAQLPLAVVKEALAPIFADATIKKYGHNVKFDLLVLHFAAGMEVGGVYADSMVAAHLLDSVQRVSLDEVAAHYLNYQTITYTEVTGGKKNLPFSAVELPQAGNYSGEDAAVSFSLCELLLHKLHAIPALEELFFAQEMPFVQVLYHMECTGAYVSADVLAKQNRQLREELAQVQTDIFVAAGQRFNIASPKQLGQVLFVSLGIPYPKKAKSKGGTFTFSTNEEVLQAIAPQYDIANLVLRYRALSKLITTYTEKLPTLIQANGRIYTSFNQTGTVTFRLSSSDPNLQNIPARTPEGHLVRTAFCAPQGYKILSADYSQIELRLIAHIAKVPHLINAFLKHQDIHKSTAAEVLGKSIEEVTPAERAHAKATNFGLMYGMSAHGLARQTGMNHRQADSYVKRYFERYPQVLQYMDEIKAKAHAQGYVTTLMGHRISFATINSADMRQQASAERAAINAPMQGSAAEIIKAAMLQIDAWIATLPPDTVRMTLQVHDELVFEVKEDFVLKAQSKIKELMEQAAHLAVPLEVGIGVADNWADAH